MNLFTKDNFLKLTAFSKNIYKNIVTYVQSENGKIEIALLPLFFSWYIIYILFSESEKIRKACYYSFLYTIYFFSLFILSFILSKIPLAGSILGNFFHLLASLSYIGLSFFTIYLYRKNKTVEIRPIEKHHSFISFWIEKKSAHSSIG